MATYMHYWSGLSVALATIAGLTPRQHDVVIIDENQEKINFTDYYDYDIIGITSMTQTSLRAYEIADEFRGKGLFVVIGGIHATVLPEEVKSHADAVFIGEAENTWPQFINDFIGGSPKQIYNQKNCPPIQMETMPTPRFDLVARYKYPVVWMQTTRGCPHDCEFCAASVIYGRNYKHKNIEQVVAEIKEIKRHWKFAQIGFADDNMFVNREFSRNLISNFTNLNFNWFAQTDISIGNDEKFLDLLKENGCKYLFIGFEGTSKNRLEKLNTNNWKAKKFDDYKIYIDKIQRKGIGIFGSFILGFDEDDESIFNDTISYINDNNLLGASITILTPFPGSRLRDRMQSENRIMHDDWSYYTAWNAVIRHKNMKPETLEDGLMKVYSGIYNDRTYLKRAKYFKTILESNL